MIYSHIVSIRQIFRFQVVKFNDITLDYKKNRTLEIENNDMSSHTRYDNGVVFTQRLYKNLYKKMRF